MCRSTRDGDAGLVLPELRDIDEDEHGPAVRVAGGTPVADCRVLLLALNAGLPLLGLWRNLTSCRAAAVAPGDQRLPSV